MLKKDKQKVLGEVFDDERVRSFLNVESYSEINTDYLALLRAYRGMNIENFETFVTYFVDAEKDLNAIGPEGKSLLQEISGHRHAEQYARALKNAGAR